MSCSRRHTPAANNDDHRIRQYGFTIVELLIVIVVIAILAAISVVAYTGIQNRAIDSGLQSDLANASRVVKLAHAESGVYPTSLPTNASPSTQNEFEYSGSDQTFCITVKTQRAGGRSYYIDQNGTATSGVCSGHTDPSQTNPAANGQTWTARTSPAPTPWNDIVYGNGRFVAVGGSNNGNHFAYSTDGINWSSASSPATSSVRAITFGNGKFVAVGANWGSGDRILTSTDGQTWARAASTPQDTHWRDVTYANGRFVAVGGSGAANTARISYSTDGETWNPAVGTDPTSSWDTVVYGNGRFIALGSSPIASTDGRTWTSITQTGIPGTIESFTFGNGRFMAIPRGYANYILTSTDAETWTSHQIPAMNPSTPWMRSISFTNGRFFIFANGPYLITGTNEQNLSVHTVSGFNLVVTAAAFGNGRVVAVGDSTNSSTPTILTSP